MQAEVKLWGELCRRQTDNFADKLAFLDVDGRATTFSAFEARVNRLNNALAARGLAKGDRVAILAKNRTAYVETYGLAKTGLIVVPLNWRLTAEELLVQLRHCRPSVIIADEQHGATIASLSQRMDFSFLFVSIGASRPGAIEYESLLNEAGSSEPVPTQALDSEDVVCLMYTSGTTGAPKAVGLSHRGIIRNAEVAITNLRLTPNDRSLAAMPLFHVGGMWYHLNPSYAAGSATILLPGFDVRTVISTLQTQAITNIHLVPTMIAALIADPEIETADLSHLRLIYYAASPIPSALLKRAMGVFSGCEFIQSYGSTEGGIVTALGPQDHVAAIAQDNEQLLGSCGRPAAGVGIRVVDDDMKALPSGRVGEIAIHGPGLMSGYWHKGEAASPAIEAGWFRSGDMGYIDASGYVFLKDRKNDMIVTGGENVYPSEVEDALYRDPAVLQAAVFGIPDPVWVERVVAVIVLRPGTKTTGEDVVAGVCMQLAAYKRPKEVFVRDELPMNAAGKILRKDLRRLFAGA